MTPALLDFQNGGAGWADAWDVVGLGHEIVVFDLSVNPPFPIADPIQSPITDPISVHLSLRKKSLIRIEMKI